MKRLIFLIWSISLIFVGCDRNDSSFNENLKSAELKMVPITGKIQSHVTETVNGIPVFGTLSGNLSHLGKLITDKSKWYNISVELDEQTFTILWKMFGSVCAANDDFLNYTLTGSFSIPDNKISGQVYFDGGTGRFCQAQGSLEFTGYADDPMNITTMYMNIEGMITNVGLYHDDENSIIIEQNESIANLFIEAWDSHDSELLTSLFANEFIYTTVTTNNFYTDKDALVQYFNNTLEGIPDSRFDIVSILANEQFAAVEWIWKGTNTVGWPALGIPATDIYFELPGISVMEIDNGKINWNNEYWDWNTFMQLIGVNP